MTKNLDREIKKITNQIVRKYKPEKIILFGSGAYGITSPDSDLDFFLVKRSKRNRVERTLEVENLVDNTKFPVDFIVFTPSELEYALKIGDFFVEDVLSTGKVLYENGK